MHPRLAAAALAAVLLALPAGAFAARTAPPAGHAPAALAIVNDSLRSWFTTRAYADTLRASGAAEPVVWSVSSGALPAGLSLDPATGVLSGVAQQPGTSTFGVTATAAGGTASKSFSVRMIEPVRITSPVELYVPRGEPFETRLQAAGGDGTYTWSITNLPAGVSADASGRIHGTVGESQPVVSYGATVRSAYGSAYRAGWLETFYFLSEPSDSAVVGTARAETLRLSARAAARFELVSGTLPPGLALGEGVISGTPTQVGSYTFTVRGTCEGCAGSVTRTFTRRIVYPDVRIVGDTWGNPVGVVGEPYSHRLQASGGDGRYTWTLESGSSAPPGLVLGADGTLSGTPTTPGQTVFGAVVSSGGKSRSDRFSVFTIGFLSDAARPAARLRVPYTDTLVFMGEYTVEGPPGLVVEGRAWENPKKVVRWTPPEPGSFQYTVRLRAGTATTSRTFSVVVAPEPLSVATSSFPQAVIGETLSTQLQAHGGTEAAAWTVAGGTLPPGLTLNRAGLLYGTAGAGGDYTFTAQVVAGAERATRDLTVHVLDFATDSVLPDAVLNTPYSHQVNMMGAVGTVNFANYSGDAVPGLFVDLQGRVRGVPTAVGTFRIEAGARTTNLYYLRRHFRITVRPGATLAITSSVERPEAVVGRPYSSQLEASGATGLGWSLGGPGALPPMLSLSPSGLVSGTPTTPGTYTFTATVRSGNLSDSRTFTLRVRSAFTVTSDSLRPQAIVGTPYADQWEAQGASGPPAWSIRSGALPAGLSLDPSTGRVTGTPTAAGVAIVVAQATGAGGQTASAGLEIPVYDPVVVTSAAARPAGVVGEVYADTLRASGGRPGHQWRLAAGALPAGLALEQASGRITGTPTAAGSYRATVEAASPAAGPARGAITGSREITLEVLPGLAISSDSVRAPGVVGTAYADTLRATGGRGGFRWSVAGGGLPAGLSLDPGGAISGVPTEEGDFRGTLRVQSGTVEATLEVLIRIRAPQLEAAQVIDGLLGGSISPEAARYLDTQGNRNGRLDVGDVRAWLIRNKQISPMRIPGLEDLAPVQPAPIPDPRP